MGLLRTLFALAVVIVHSPWHGNGGYVLMGGRNAVQLFYMISGFLIAYILNNSPAYRNDGTFYLNRALRIYPIYYVVAAMAAVGSLLAHAGSVQAILQMPAVAKAALVAVNAVLFGQDWVMFMAIHGGHFGFTTNFENSDVPVFAGLLVPQAWTLGLELTFYLIAPFVVRSRTRIVVLLALSLLARLAFYLWRPDLAASDPWTHRFFPFELSLFLLGALSQQVLLPVWQNHPRKKAFANYGTIGFFLLSSLIFLVPANEFVKSLVLFLTFFFCLPLAFIFQNHHPWDSEVGDLSYPIYIGHWLAKGATVRLLAKLGLVAPFPVTLIVIVSSLAFAAALNYGIAQPIEKLRARVKKRRAPVVATD
jgi:peptidoglycan/LPS O-acetylase OafA/YrhL